MNATEEQQGSYKWDLLRVPRVTRKWSMINGVTISTLAGRTLASHVEENSKDIVAAALRSMGPDQRTGSIAASVFANTFLDQLAVEVESGDREGLDAWVSAISDPESAF